uniref:Agenet domain-containing protein n=1 Tax=Oryza barthii TaxID=65489 RepID=A0A0D3EQ42_9ORYZ
MAPRRGNPDRWRRDGEGDRGGGGKGSGDRRSRKKMTRVSRGASPCASSSGCGSRRERAELGLLLVQMEPCGHAVGSLARPRVANLNRVCTVRAGLHRIFSKFVSFLLPTVALLSSEFQLYKFPKPSIISTQRLSHRSIMEWEEDGEKAAGSGGQRGGAPLYAVGDEVEVRMDDPGFHGAFYEATVSARLPCSGRYEVMYSTLAKLPASLVRRRRAFVRGRWMDARDVVPRVPQYDEGSNVEVMLDTGKHRAAWVTATVIKMVSSKNYVVRLKNKEGSVNIVDYCYIRPQPTFDRKKFEYELEPSAEVEVNLGGAWSLGVISDVGSCGYGVRLKGHDSSEEEDYMLVSRALLRPYCKLDDQELMPCTAKEFACTSLDLPCISAPKDAVEIKGKSSYVDVVEISDNSGYDVIHISDDSSCNPRRKRRRQNLLEEELHSRHTSYPIQESQSRLNMSPARSPLNCDPLLDVMRHPKVESCNHVLSPILSPLETPQAHFNNNAGQLIPLPSYPVLEKLPVKVLPEMNETKETNHAHLQAEFLAPDDCTAGDQNYALPIKVEVESWVADIRKKEAAMQTITDSGEDNSRRPRSGDSEIPNSSKLEPYSSEQQRHTFQFVSRNKLEVPVRHKKAPDALEMNTNSVVFFPKEQTHSKKIIDASHYESYASLQQHPLGQCQVPNYWSAAGQSSFVHPSITMNLFTILPAPNSHPTTFASSLLMGPCEKMEVFENLPQLPHFGKLIGCPPELREGKALGLMASFANIAESIQNMRIQDEENVFEEKLRCLSELEEDGFDVRALKERLENLVSIKNHQTELKKRRARLDQFMLEREVDNASVEQSQKLLDIMIKELELKLLEYREKKASLVEKKAANCSEIAKLQGDMDQIEESFLSAEYDFHTTAAAPW